MFDNYTLIGLLDISDLFIERIERYSCSTPLSHVDPLWPTLPTWATLFRTDQRERVSVHMYEQRTGQLSEEHGPRREKNWKMTD